ncbi:MULTISPECIES: tRNA (N(6)-L-threonylcarbamoyladenosine(37)-C(2))-methylthiotransferase MtaB [unclassified Campylobacter]|nr:MULTISPECIES: tRNA (N(6)-L-threonylcarbamoyladenosine(37)-C(2))-methylthiotransferase MtaB [unclassified Campylobacter]MBZ7978463.1 tRNA (N(6)-L-threonylcarbamoyladenosine(37)-C(2))-methylthiotransferase MtaB [Campylobacter sp. RM12654]MBZ7991794.1 tRNA (N(6)-L-threonylcarbamoyladenosine(37)-C(2))-methylthiotransferase MtaB [Campylobacter sp. RM9331]MBZ7993552.1 tRNA (N(6)-L-threonylcarbamoyladenosine(37)-C(2))-methylthiotransferase MtaB [Campylobacter sp. RM9333]MBZ8006096.1 tRNA (N(6)-L-th
MKIYIKTFGCRTNIYDSELIKSYIKDNEIINDELQADMIVINSCTVTNQADLGLKQYIRHIKNHNPNTKFILTGCAAASIGKSLYDSKIVDGVMGASLKSNINKFILNPKEFDLGNLNFIDEKIVSNYENHTKAFVKIQEGCDFACSYCIIPSVRGGARSLKLEQIINQIKTLANNGYKEVVLTGTNIGSYGKDLNLSLAKLLKEISKINGIKRVRLGSIEPVQIDDEFKELLDEDFIEKHLHIALQHTNEKMLKLMQRRNKAYKDLELFEYLANKGYALGTDYIVGHPGESDEIWADAINNFKKFPITHLHAFVYSKRDGTKSVELAKTLGEVDKNISKQRLNEIKEITRLKNYEFRKNQKDLIVLVEQFKDGYYQGYDQYFNLIKIKSDKDLLKTWINIKDYEVEIDKNKAIY